MTDPTLHQLHVRAFGISRKTKVRQVMIQIAELAEMFDDEPDMKDLFILFAAMFRKIEKELER